MAVAVGGAPPLPLGCGLPRCALQLRRRVRCGVEEERCRRARVAVWNGGALPPGLVRHAGDRSAAARAGLPRGVEEERPLGAATEIRHPPSADRIETAFGAATTSEV